MSDNTPQEQPRKEISAEEFIKIWKGEYKSVEGYEGFYQKKHGQEIIVFNGYTVKGDIKIKEEKELPNIELRNTETDEFWIYNNSTTGYFNVQDNSTVGDFFIYNNSTTGYFRILGNSTTGNFNIYNNSTTGAFSIIENSIVGKFWIYNNSATGYFNIYKNSKTGEVTVYKNSTTGDFYIQDNSITGNFSILDNSLISDFWVLNNSTTGHFYIVNSITGYFYIRDNSTMGDFIIRDNTVVASIYINASLIQNIHIDKHTYIGKIELVYLNAECKTLTFEASTVGKLKLKLDKPYQITIKKGEIGSVIHTLDFEESILPKDTYLHISDTCINEINIDSFLNHGIIIFNNIKPIQDLKQFELDNKSNPIRLKGGEEKGKYKFQHVQKESNFTLINSDLVNTQFIGCDLAGFDEFVFKNSKMASVFLADTALPHRTKITTTDGANENEQRRLALSQFKKIYEGQGDMVRAAEFRAEEMEVYREQLVKKEKFGTWLILSFSYYTSNYGQSIWLPLAALLVVHYWLFMWALGVGAFEFLYPNELVYHFFYLANPIRGYEFRNDWTIIIDILMRVWSSYMVYNFIRASRRFIK